MDFKPESNMTWLRFLKDLAAMRRMDCGEADQSEGTETCVDAIVQEEVIATQRRRVGRADVCSGWSERDVRVLTEKPCWWIECGLWGSRRGQECPSQAGTLGGCWELFTWMGNSGGNDGVEWAGRKGNSFWDELNWDAWEAGQWTAAYIDQELRGKELEI